MVSDSVDSVGHGVNGRVTMIYSRLNACGLEMEDVTGGKIEDAPSWAI